MDLEGVREALHRRPFKPFDICTADGRRLPVTHPDSVAVGSRRIFVIGPDDSYSFVELSVIISLDYTNEHPSKRNHRIRQLYNAAPFTPFIIHLADGRQIAVKRREYMALSPSGRTIVVYQADDISDIIDLLLVTDLEIGNGKAPNRRRS